MNPTDRKALLEFQQKVTRLERAVSGALDAANSLNTRLEQIKRALDHTPGSQSAWKEAVRTLEKRNREILLALRGDEILRNRNENTPLSISERVGGIIEGERLSLSRPTTTHVEQYQIAGDEFRSVLAKLRSLIDVDLRKLEKELDKIGAPWTPGRLPDWTDK